MSCAVAIFVKTPGHSPVKSRLWPDLGRAAAEQLHLASAAAVCSVVCRASATGILEGYWATAEAVSSVAASWPGLSHVGQVEGGLGLRMAVIHRELRARHGATILIGADAPQLESEHLVQATNWLRSSNARLVIGRARDGGFWLFGSNRDLPEACWTQVDYSKASTANEFVRAMDGYGEWLELQILQDIDIAADIESVRDQLRELNDPTPEQSRLTLLLDEVSRITGPCA